MICRPSMLREMRAAGCFADAAFVSSLWMGYVQQSERQLRILDGQTASHTHSASLVARHHIHTSGHATIAALRRLVQAFPDSRIVPIHLDNPEEFAKLAENVDLKNDQQWWEV